MSYLTEMCEHVLYVVWDLETTSRHKGSYFGATPYDMSNGVVLSGYRELGENSIIEHNFNFKELQEYVTTAKSINAKVVLIGCNIGFDLSWLMHRAPSMWQEIKQHIMVWDCSVAHYLMCGQSVKYPSMDDMAKHYGFAVKPDTLKRYLEAGVDVADIPMQELVDYLKHDLITTENIFAAQIAQLTGGSGQMFDVPPIYLVRMEDVLMTTTMEVNGMAFDSAVASNLVDADLPTLTAKELSIRSTVEALWGIREFNATSSSQIAKLIYGGDFTYTTKVPMVDEHGEYVQVKSGVNKGTVKLHNQENTVRWVGALIDPRDYPDRSVDEERILDIIATKAVIPEVLSILEDVLTVRTLRKDISTYYIGYPKFAELDGFLHTSINQTGTVTGRLSSSRPNLQNAAHNHDE